MVIGLDFGTYCSQEAICQNNNPTTLVTRGHYGIPSVFYYSDVEGGAFIGKEAEERSQFDPQNYVRDVKMHLDQSFTLDGKNFSSSDIVKSIYNGMILHAKDQLKEIIGDDTIDGVVISHPAKFSIQKIGLLVNAVENCMGPNEPIKVLGTIKEPVAAALTYYHEDPQPDGTNILVFDLGGGTCDVAIVTSDRKEPSQFKVVDADTEEIGGRDWDDALVNFMVDKINATGKSGDVKNNPTYMKEIRSACVDAKHRLTEKTEATIRINLGAEQYNTKITRDEFDALTVHLLNKALDKLDELYERNVKIADTITAVICVGGSSKMPQVENGIIGRLPSVKVRVWNPEYAVVNGASILANRLLTGFDFVPFSYGIRGKSKSSPTEHIVRNIIRKGDKYPISCVCDSFLIPAGQVGATLTVYESECANQYYPCDGTQNEKAIGYISLKSQTPAKKDEVITCKLTINSLHTIEIEAHSETLSDVSASFKLANI